MPRIKVTKHHDTLPATLAGEVGNWLRKVEERAYALFEGRGRLDGGDLEDWLAAEQQLLGVGPAELIDNGREIQVQIALPGFTEDEIRVTATPTDLVVEANASKKSELRQGLAQVSEYQDQRVYRSFKLPAPVDVERITATLDQGTLRVSAAKAESGGKRETEAASPAAA